MSVNTPLVFDETNLALVAGLVARFNRHARGCDLIACMKQTAQREISDRPSYVSTLGFMLTSYQPVGATGLHIKASIDTSAFHGVEFKITQYR